MSCLQACLSPSRYHRCHQTPRHPGSFRLLKGRRESQQTSKASKLANLVWNLPLLEEHRFLAGLLWPIPAPKGRPACDGVRDCYSGAAQGPRQVPWKQNFHVLLRLFRRTPRLLWVLAPHLSLYRLQELTAKMCPLQGLHRDPKVITPVTVHS